MVCVCGWLRLIRPNRRLRGHDYCDHRCRRGGCWFRLVVRCETNQAAAEDRAHRPDRTVVRRDLPLTLTRVKDLET